VEAKSRTQVPEEVPLKQVTVEPLDTEMREDFQEGTTPQVVEEERELSVGIEDSLREATLVVTVVTEKMIGHRGQVQVVRELTGTSLLAVVASAMAMLEVLGG